MLRRIILHQKSYSQLSMRCSISSLEAKMFERYFGPPASERRRVVPDEVAELLTWYSQAVRRIKWPTALTGIHRQQLFEKPVVNAGM
jgi:hypothetical protein